MEFLKGLNTETAILVVGFWLFRELLGWVRNLIKDLKNSSADPVAVMEMKQLLEAIRDIGEHIKKQTEINQQFLYEIRDVKGTVARIENDVERLKGG